MQNLQFVYEKASQSLAPGGSVVWVTTTPHAFMKGYSDCGLTGSEFNDRIIEYNEIASTFFSSKANVTVCDLNAAVNAVCGPGYEDCNLQRWNNVHFTTAGKQFCAIELSETIAPLINNKWLSLQPK